MRHVKKNLLGWTLRKVHRSGENVNSEVYADTGTDVEDPVTEQTWLKVGDVVHFTLYEWIWSRLRR